MSLRDTINHEKRGYCKTFASREKSSFRATPAEAGGDPESSAFVLPGSPLSRGRRLDSGFRRNDGVSEPCKSLMKKLFGAEGAESAKNKLKMEFRIYNPQCEIPNPK
jgi:hypothetical protein